MTRLRPVLTVLALGAAATAQPLVVIDPGHGARDPGAVGCGSQEDDVVLDVGRRMRPTLEAAGLRVAMTREEERFVELRARAAFANDRGARGFVSVHANANGGAPASGSETWIAEGAGADTVRLAEGLQRALVATWGLRDRGVKRRNFTVLTATAMPAALTELGFINHCERDSALLANANERQRIADAQARAVAAWLGVDAPPPGPAVGVLLGVVFEDVGAGLEDTSVRLPGARVTVEQTGDGVRSEAETGAWRFELEPGDYTVSATLDGFDAATRDCTVAAGMEAWCSVGLRPSAGPPPPTPDAAPAPAPDAAVPDAAIPDATALDDGGRRSDAMGARPDGTVRRDATVSSPEAGIGFAEGVVVRADPSIEGGCGVTGGGASGWWFAALLLPLAVRRRRLLALLALLGGAAGAHVPDVHPDGESAVRGETRADLRPSGARVLLRGGFAAATLSPDGRHVALSAADLGSVYVARTDDGALRRFATGARSGLAPRWVSADVLAWRGPAQSSTAVPTFARTLDGVDLVPPAPPHGVRAWAEDEGVYVWRDGVLGVASPMGDRFFHVRVSPDGSHLVFWGLRTGLHLVRLADGRRFALGSGGHPSFDPTGRWLVFERTEDEGAQLVAGDLFLVDVRHPDEAVALTQTSDRVELAPTVAGGKLVFLAGDAVIVADLILPR